MALWTPAAITTERWFDSLDVGSLTLNSGNVEQWNDKSGKGVHAVQAVAALQPPFTVENGIYFNGDTAKHYLTAGVAEWPEKLTILCVAQNTGTATTERLINCADNNIFYLGERGNSFNATYGTGSGFSFLAAAQPNRKATDTSIMGSSRSAFDTGGATPLFNGEELDVVHGGSAAGSYTMRFSGTEVNNDIQHWTGSLREVVLILTDDKDARQHIEGYMAHRWGIADSLVAGHPFKSSPPTLDEAFLLRHNPRTNKVIPVLTFPTVTDIGATCVRPRVTKGY